jgi:putative restriction endonuclease
MRGFVGNTDLDWLTFLRSVAPPIDEMNFWRAGRDAFRALRPGEPFFFRLTAPHNAIAGFGWFAHFSMLPISVAWQICGEANGAPSYAEMRQRLMRIRSRFDMATDAKEDFPIGCILLTQPVFFREDEWVRGPTDFAASIVQGKRYDLGAGEGARIWHDCLTRAGVDAGIRPRLGRRSFQVAVLDAYGRRCAITGEEALPTLAAARIRDDHHSVNNGILLRADLCRLFEAGYVTVTPEYRVAISRRLGEEYRRYDGEAIRLPENPADAPLVEALYWHQEQRYLG